MGTSIYFKYRPDEKFGGKKVLNIGCGSAQFKAPNVVNLDAYGNCNPDVVWNLEKSPLPFESETFDLIIANHVFEHIHNWWELFNDCGRLLKVGGKIEIHIPGSASDGQMGYRDHVSYINHMSFYGVYDCERPGSNAWAASQEKSYAAKLKCKSYSRTLIKKWWIQKAPYKLQMWFSEYLRNIILEENYIFERII